MVVEQWGKGRDTQKKEAYKEMTNNPTEETQNEYRRLKKAAKKAVARAMKDKAVRRINEIDRNRNNVFRFVNKAQMLLEEGA